MHDIGFGNKVRTRSHIHRLRICLQSNETPHKKCKDEVTTIYATIVHPIIVDRLNKEAKKVVFLSFFIFNFKEWAGWKRRGQKGNEDRKKIPSFYGK